MVRTAAGPVLAGILAAGAAEDVLRRCFAEARERAAGVRVLLAGPAPAAGDDVLLDDLVDRWAEKYPDVPVTVVARRGLDAAITLTAATRGCGLVVVAEPADVHEAAVVQALARRAYCPLAVVTPRAESAEPAVAAGNPPPWTGESGGHRVEGPARGVSLVRESRPALRSFGPAGPDAAGAS